MLNIPAVFSCFCFQEAEIDVPYLAPSSQVSQLTPHQMLQATLVFSTIYFQVPPKYGSDWLPVGQQLELGILISHLSILNASSVHNRVVRQ